MKIKRLILVPSVLLLLSFMVPGEPDWGFFGHRRINRMAVFTLPPEMMAFFKPNIDYLTDHAVDPDMRRYAVSWEAPRHYIDLDAHTVPIDQLPRTWTEALLKFVVIKGVTAQGDTTIVYNRGAEVAEEEEKAWKSFFIRNILPAFSSEDKAIHPDSLNHLSNKMGFKWPRFESAKFEEGLSEHGILPWNLQTSYHRLINAFKDKNGEMILKLCADIGHYVGDAHVPLHTTSNYNGQKTGQVGIHAFWESRIPELFADKEYDYLVGKPEYIGTTSTYFWNIVLESHSSVDSVLGIEWAMRTVFPPDQQMCFDIRSGVQVLTQCRDFAAAYQARMDGMVEQRMTQAIHSVASVWYSAWLDAGSPDLSQVSVNKKRPNDPEEEAMQKGFQDGKIKGRPEEH